MNSFTFLSTAGSIALSGGIFLVAYPCLLTCIELLVRIWHKIFATWAERRLRQMGILRSKPYQAQVELDWKRLGVLIAIPFLASAVHDLLLSPLVLLIGTTILIWMNVRNRQVEQAQVDEDAETVALQIRSLLSIDHSMINALCQVKLPPGRMRQAIEQISSRLRLQQSPEQAVHSFTNLPGVVTARLSALIAQSSRLTDQVQDELLATLEQEAHRQKSRSSANAPAKPLRRSLNRGDWITLARSNAVR